MAQMARVDDPFNLPTVMDHEVGRAQGHLQLRALGVCQMHPT